jgi:hypothetical protein
MPPSKVNRMVRDECRVERTEKNMKKKLTPLILSAMLFALSYSASAQQPAKISQMGFLTNTPFSDDPESRDALRQGLRELGYFEGENILIEWRSGERSRDRQRAFAAELVRLKVDVIVAVGSGDIIPTLSRSLGNGAKAVRFPQRK